eukprot:6207658-Pleurochrysis_carterae.AAC.2
MAEVREAMAEVLVAMAEVVGAMADVVGAMVDGAGAMMEVGGVVAGETSVAAENAWAEEVTAVVELARGGPAAAALVVSKEAFARRQHTRARAEFPTILPSR